MAKTLDELKKIREQIVINPHTVKDETAVKSFMKESAWTGEIAVQQIKNDNVKLWTLGKDNETAVDFIDRQTIEGLISSGSSLSIVSAIPSSTKVLEEWRLINTTTSGECGEHIKIYKDQNVTGALIGRMDDTINPTTGEITLGTTGNTALILKKFNASGLYETIKVDIEDFVQEHEFESGVTCENHIVHGVVAPFGKTNDNFLFVDGDGFYTSGITESIALEIVSAATPNETVKESWKLFNKKLNKRYGEIINIYKDQHMVAAMIGKSGATVDAYGNITDGSLENTALLISKINASGNSELIQIDMQRFIEETEIGHGLEMSGHTLVGKVASGITSPDNHLFVDDRGFYLSGLTEILPVLSGLTMAKAKASSDRYGYVTVDSAQTGEHLTYTVSGYDIASYTVVGSGWVSSSITEVIIENEKITAKALNNIAKCISALTPSSEDKTVVITPSFSGTDYSVNIDNTTIGKDSNGVLSTLLMIASAVPSTANVYEEWRLVDQNYDEISGSSHIMIYKDSALIQVYIGKTDDKCDPITGVITSGTTGATALCFLYMLADGKYELVAIDVTLFFSEEIFKKGFEIDKSAHTIDVKIDSISEPYLTVSMDGLKISGVSAISAFEVMSAATTDNKVKEAWKIYNPILKKQHGDIIKIYKDQHLTSAKIGHMDDVIDATTGIITDGYGDTALVLVKLNASGGYETLKVNIEDFVQEHEFASGITHTGHIVHGVVAPKTDPYLYVDADGFFLSGITGIANVVSGETEAEAIAKADRLGHVVVESAQTGSHVTYTVKGYDVASNDVLMELSASTIESADTLYKMILSATPKCADKTIIVTPSTSGTNLSVNIDSNTIGKNASGVLSTLLMIASAVPSFANVREEWMLIGKDGNEVSGSSHIKIYQNCEVSGETMADAIAAADGLGHVVVESAMTSAGTVVYIVNRYDIASNSALTELSAATIESADTLYKMILSASPVSSGNTILVGNPSSAGTNLEVNIDNKTIGKDVSGILRTLLLISSVTPSVGIKEEYALMDGDGNEISGSTHIKIGQTCKVSGETMADAIAAADGLGHVVVDSAMTSAGTVIYTIDRYDIASNSALTELSAWTMDYVGSGWVASSITEVIVENERVIASALNDLNDRIDNMNYTDNPITNWYVDYVDEAYGVISPHRIQLPVAEVKNFYDSGDTRSANVEILTDSASTVTVNFSKIRIDCGLF